MNNIIKIKKNNEEYFLIDKDKNPFICNQDKITKININLFKEYIDKNNKLPPINYKFTEPEILNLTCKLSPKSNQIFTYDENEETKKLILADININNFEKLMLKFNLPVNEYEKKIRI